MKVTDVVIIVYNAQSGDLLYRMTIRLVDFVNIMRVIIINRHVFTCYVDSLEVWQQPKWKG
jgi:hypothetical protein